MKLLIAEDNVRMRQFLRDLCAGPDDHVIECADGHEAVAAYALHQPDWVLMDLNMPALGGLAATRSILERNPGARIVVVSELSESDYGDAARLAGARDYVTKDDLQRLPRLLESP